MSLQDRKNKADAKIALLTKKLSERTADLARQKPLRLATHLQTNIDKLNVELANEQANLAAVNAGLSEEAAKAEVIRQTNIVSANARIKARKDVADKTLVKERIKNLKEIAAGIRNQIVDRKRALDELENELKILQAK